MTTPWGSLLWFAAVVLAIPLVLWLLRRTPLGGAATGAPGTPRTVAVLPLSTQQRLVTVEVGQGDERRWLVLGVTPQGITPLHTMAPQPGADIGTVAAPPSFGQMMQRLRPGGAAGHAR